MDRQDLLEYIGYRIIKQQQSNMAWATLLIVLSIIVWWYYIRPTSEDKK
jgi:hypothetical protein